MNNLKRLMDEADEILEKEKTSKLEKARNEEQSRADRIQLIADQFVLCLPHMTIIQELLFEHHKVIFDHYTPLPSDLFNMQSGIGEYDCGGGFEYDKRLYQQSDTDVDRTISMAWAISFENVFGKNVYLLPYRKYKSPSNGFACTITSNNSYDFFPHDVPRQFAISWLADYKRKQN